MKSIRHLMICLLALASLGLSGCDNMIYSDLEPCLLEVSYRYDYNLKFADAFASQVPSVDLFIFDDQGRAAATPLRVEGNPFAEDFSHPLQLQPGKYTLVAWAGLSDSSYALSNIADLAQMRLAIKSSAGISDKALDHLWHGIVRRLEVKGVPGERVVIPLIKDTNTFRVQLVTTGEGVDLDPDKYQVEIASANGLLDGDNRIVPGDAITYRPYLSEHGRLSIAEDKQAVGLTCELRTGCLSENSDDRLIVTDKKSGKKLINVKLKELIQFLKLSEYGSMPLQEYMDRQDEYVVSFVFTTSGPASDVDFLSFSIYINGWLIREQDISAE